MALRALPVAEPEGIRFNIDEQFNKRCARVYRCYFDPDDSDAYVGSNLPPGVAYHTPFPSYAGYIVVAIDGVSGSKCTLPGNALHVDGSGNPAPGAGSREVRQWDISAQYGPWTPLLDSQDGNPLNRPTTLRTMSQRTTRPARNATDGKPILNTVGLPFDPAPEKDAVANTLVIERAVPTIDLSVNLPAVDSPDEDDSGGVSSGPGWVDRVNADQYGPFPPRTLKVAPIVYRQENHQTCGVFYVREVSLEIAPLGTWDKVLANLSKQEYDTSQASTGVDADGNPTYPLKAIIHGGLAVDEPVFIDAQGKYVDPPVLKDNIVNLTFKVYHELDFASLFGEWSTLTPSGGGTG